MWKKHRGYAIGMICFIVVVIIALGCRVYANYREAYKPLGGVSIVLDPGHGGRDDGAKAENIKEQEVNLKIAFLLQKRLEDVGANVTLTRDGAYDLASEQAQNRKKEDMKNRIAIINQADTDLFLSIHLNAYPNASAKGAQVFYEKNNPSQQAFADMVQKHLQRLTGIKKTSKSGDYYILNNATTIGALVECGFISNSEDRAKLLKDDYQEEIANTLYDSIVEYFNVLI